MSITKLIIASGFFILVGGLLAGIAVSGIEGTADQRYVDFFMWNKIGGSIFILVGILTAIYSLIRTLQSKANNS